MKSKQTAVEWLVEQMIERKYFAKDVPLSYTTLEHLVNQAKAMEKEQIIQAASWTPEDGLSVLSELAQQYYNQTFKSE